MKDVLYQIIIFELYLRVEQKFKQEEEMMEFAIEKC